MLPQVPTITAAQLAEALQSERSALVLDVREDMEIAADSLPDILHIPLGELQLRVEDIPTGQPVAVICRSGRRSAHATAFLITEGYEAVNVEGGMIAFRNL